MALDITPEQMAVYQATARRRRQQKAQALAARHQRAWQVAREGAQLLKERFGAKRVVVFGSALFPEKFYVRSDVDLAVWGVPERLYYRAVSRLLSLDPGISVDLVEAELAPPELLATIEREGVVL